MITVKLERADGEVLASFPFPTSASEVKYSTYVRFEEAYEAKEKWLKENESANITDPAFVRQYILHVAKIVEAFTGQSVIEAKLGDYVAHVQEVFGEDVRAFQNELREVENTVFSLYANIWRTIGNYKKHAHTDNAYHFTYKGKTYFLKSAYRDAITGQLRFDSLSVAQGVEALEAWRIYEQAKGNDVGKRYLFTTVVTLIACLALEDGQQFPDNEKDIQRWITERSVHFQDIDMETALNVRDFFLHTTNPLLRTQNINGSSVRPSTPTNAKAKHGRSMNRRTRRPPRA